MGFSLFINNLLSHLASFSSVHLPAKHAIHFGYGRVRNLRPGGLWLEPAGQVLEEVRRSACSGRARTASVKNQPNSDGLQPTCTSDGLQPTSKGLQPNSDGLQPTCTSDGHQPTSQGLQPISDGLQPIKKLVDFSFQGGHSGVSIECPAHYSEAFCRCPNKRAEQEFSTTRY